MSDLSQPVDGSITSGSFPFVLRSHERPMTRPVGSVLHGAALPRRVETARVPDDASRPTALRAGDVYAGTERPVHVDREREMHTDLLSTVEKSRVSHRAKAVSRKTTVLEDRWPRSRLEDMTYPTYEDVRAHERELLRLAQKNVQSSVPRRNRHSIFRENGVLASLRRRYATAARRTGRPSRTSPARA